APPIHPRPEPRRARLGRLRDRAAHLADLRPRRDLVAPAPTPAAGPALAHASLHVRLRPLPLPRRDLPPRPPVDPRRCRPRRVHHRLRPALHADDPLHPLLCRMARPPDGRRDRDRLGRRARYRPHPHPTPPHHHPPSPRRHGIHHHPRRRHAHPRRPPRPRRIAARGRMAPRPRPAPPRLGGNRLPPLHGLLRPGLPRLRLALHDPH